MSKRYPGNFITGNPVALSQTSNNGIWDLKDQYQATGNDTWREGDGNYEIGRSLRFRSSVGTTLSRTNIVGGNQDVWTMSFWFKRGRFGASASAHGIMGCYAGVNNDSNNFEFRFVQADKLQVVLWNYTATTTAVFRDTSAWYHIVLTLDTTVATGPKIKVYVNGDLQEWDSDSISPNLASGANLIWNATTTQYLGRWQGSDGGNYWMDGCMTELNFIDGQALDPSYFGYFDSITNIWYPKRYTGTYGKTGYYLPFNDNTNVYGLGNDKKATTSIGSYTTGSLTTSVYKFGGSAFSLASGAYVFPGGLGSGYGIHNPMHNIDGKDFTIEFWYKGQASDTNFGSQDGVLTGYNYFVSKGRTNTASNGWGIHLYSNGGIALETFGGSGGNSGTVGFTGGSGGNPSILDNEWHHIAISRASGTVRVFIDGTQRASGSMNFTCDNTYGIVINGMWDYTSGNTLTYKIGGTIDDFRMYTGIAKYTSSFVAPIVPLPIGEGDQYWGYVSCALPFDGSSGSSQIPAWIPNYWTPNSFSLTDSMVDSPVNVFTSATDIGGVVPGNYATLSNLVPQTNSSLTDGNLQWFNQSGVGTSYAKPASFWGPGKWYFEVTVTNGSATSVMDTGAIGVMVYDPAVTYASRSIGYGGADYVWRYDGYKATNGTLSAYGTAVNSNTDVVMCAYDTSNNTVWFGKNGTWFASSNPATATSPAFTDSVRTDLEYLFKPIVHSTHGGGGTAVNVVNFGQRQFAYTPPAGFKSLCTTNLQERGASTVATAALTPNKWFDVNLYGGTGASRNITNSGFQPDLVWIKHRSSAENHNLYDSARGPGLRLESNSAAVEFQYLDRLTSFNNNGFSLGGGYNNTSGTSYAAWQWKQSPTAGFNVISYTGDGTNNRAISHNLGVKPAFIIVKDTTVGYNWDIFHKSLGISATLIFTDAGTRNVSAFGSTAPTASNFFTQNSYTNSSGSKMIAYLWAEVPGFSRIASFTGTSSTDGPFIYCGFRPRFIIAKSLPNGAFWVIHDTARDPSNVSDRYLYPNNSNAEEQTYSKFDILSNGFKCRNTNDNVNYSGVTTIFAAFAESPFGLNNRAR